MNTATGIIKALNSGIKHLAIKRFTLRYPEEKLKFVGDGYQFDHPPVLELQVIKVVICYFMIIVLAVSCVPLHVRE